MAVGFSASAAEWTAYFAFTGGAAAALLGLLFVAVSLRLDLFRRPEVADVRDGAWLAFGELLAAMALAGVALAPHARAGVVAGAAIAVGVGGLAALAVVVAVWARVGANQRKGPGVPALRPQDALYFMALGVPALAVLAAGVMLIGGSPAPLALLATGQGLMTAAGAFSAWLMLSHARPPGGG